MSSEGQGVHHCGRMCPHPSPPCNNRHTHAVPVLLAFLQAVSGPDLHRAAARGRHSGGRMGRGGRAGRKAAIEHPAGPRSRRSRLVSEHKVRKELAWACAVRMHSRSPRTCMPPCLQDDGAAAAARITAAAGAHALEETIPSLAIRVQPAATELEHPEPIIADRIAARKEDAAAMASDQSD